MTASQPRPLSQFAFTVWHTQIGDRPFWHMLDGWRDHDIAVRRARNYTLDHGGYVCVIERSSGNVIFGTDPAELNRAIDLGINVHFSNRAA